MADPISLGVLAVTSVAASVLSASAQQQQAGQQAALYRQQAEQTQNAEALQDQQIKIKADQTMGQQLARAGGAGVDVTTGSIADDVGETQANAARDVFSNDYTAQSKIDNLDASASNVTANAQTGFTNALIGGGLKLAGLGAGSLINGLGAGSNTFNTNTYGSYRPPQAINGTGIQSGGI